MTASSLSEEHSQRHWADRGFRPLFAVLKVRKFVFTDPTRSRPTVDTRTTLPMRLDAATIRAALNHFDPATALGVAIVAFHSLTNSQTRATQLTDIVNGRLTLPDGRSIPLAEPARVRLTSWLDYRSKKWPATINPHLLVTQQTASRLPAPGVSFPWKKAGLNPRSLRTDRILQEVYATGGDFRRICDLRRRVRHPLRRDPGTPSFREDIPKR